LMRWADEPAKAEHGLTVVSRDWRRRGLASALKERQIAWAAANGVRHLVTYTQTGNENMQAVNARLGYVTTDVTVAFMRSLPL
jgi:GNAT superfamily N-acetyltransferase